jgi:hypothetical protein
MKVCIQYLSEAFVQRVDTGANLAACSWRRSNVSSKLKTSIAFINQDIRRAGSLKLVESRVLSLVNCGNSVVDMKLDIR